MEKQSMTKILAEIKALKWSVLQLGKAGFIVAVAEINGLPVCFSAHSAYVITDDKGYFEACDYKGLMKKAGDNEASNWSGVFELAVYTYEDGISFVYDAEDAVVPDCLKGFDFRAMESQLQTYCATITKVDIQQELKIG